MGNIYNDNSRFKKIIKGKIKENLKKYIVSDDMLGKEGDKIIKIPVPKIHLPRFIHDPQSGSGVSQGDGNSGDPLDKDKQKKSNDGKAGNQESDHIYDAEITIDELGKLFGDVLQLPKLKPKERQAHIKTKSKKYSSTNKTGPSGLLIYKRIYKRALIRSIASNDYDYNKPIVIPQREDFIYKYPKITKKPDVKVAILYLMDVSGSMFDEIRDIVKTICYWIDVWLHYNYGDKFETRYIIHDVKAIEIEKDNFYKINTSGGTLLSSALILCNEIIDKDYDPDIWNTYVFQFSDGDTWGALDDIQCIKQISELQNKVNQFNYCEICARDNRNTFIDELNNEHFDDSVRSIKIYNRVQIINVLEKFFRE